MTTKTTRDDVTFARISPLFTDSLGKKGFFFITNSKGLIANKIRFSRLVSLYDAKGEGEYE